MLITRRTVADKIAAYLRHEITLAQLVDWAERALLDGELEEADAAAVSDRRGSQRPPRRGQRLVERYER